MATDVSGLSGKVAIVTGASSGIGCATARLLARRGVKLALVARSREKLEALSRELPGSRVFVADMTEIPGIVRMVQEVRKTFGRIDILVNNAGRGYETTVEKIDIALFRALYDLNVIGPVVAMQQVIPVMRGQGGGTIVNISSGTALMHRPGIGVYSSSKRALAGISLAARQELEGDHIIVSVVYPFRTVTNFWKNRILPPSGVAGEMPAGGPYPPDSAEFIAEKIVSGIVSGDAEIFAHDWMREQRV
ncbi:MAG TPA: SDR family NAD(P)-dependent oxidoreductase [Methanoregula sp.]|nr:SDR family NAD(P)-dependent oxidoreductase [Methanoregula sp.]